MRRPPRRSGAALFGLREILAGFGRGAVILVAVLGLYFGLLPELGEGPARAAGYVALAVGNLALALAIGGSAGVGLFHPRRRLFWIIAGALVLILLPALYVPGLAGLFQFGPPPPGALALAIGCGLVAGGWSGVLRTLLRRRNPGPAPLRSDP